MFILIYVTFIALYDSAMVRGLMHVHTMSHTNALRVDVIALVLITLLSIAVYAWWYVGDDFRYMDAMKARRMSRKARMHTRAYTTLTHQ